jgi:cytochrome P450
MFLINFVARFSSLRCFYNINISHFNTILGEQWYHDRKLINPSFGSSMLKQYAVVQSAKAEILTTCLERKIKENPEKAIDICPFMFNAALDIICGNVSFYYNLQPCLKGIRNWIRNNRSV